MPSKKTHDVVATIGTYKDGQGNEKKRYTNVGSAFTNDEGQISIKLDCVPVSPEWSGWLSLYVPKEKDFNRSEQRPQARAVPTPPRTTAVAEPNANTPLEDDDIPF